MDLTVTDGDLVITDGSLSAATGPAAVAQDIRMGLSTWLTETPYDTAVGLPYLQIIFKRGTTPEAARFIVETFILSRDGVAEVLTLDTQLDAATRQLTITGSVLLDSGDVVEVST